MCQRFTLVFPVSVSIIVAQSWKCIIFLHDTLFVTSLHKMTECLIGQCLRHVVDTSYNHNAMLKGKSRAIDIYEGDKLNETALKALIRSGVEHNLAKVKPTKARKR